MKRRQPHSSDRSQRFEDYLEQLTRCAGHADRVVPMENYTKGLLLPLERKSVEPMAARLAPGNVRRCTSPCITLWPMQPGAMQHCCNRCASRSCRR
jgi:SRSO17 transposase